MEVAEGMCVFQGSNLCEKVTTDYMLWIVYSTKFYLT